MLHPFIDTSKLRNTDTERDEDMRITIKLDITVGQHNLVDQFEWDINCPDNNPEKFAEVLCKELNLSGEVCDRNCSLYSRTTTGLHKIIGAYWPRV